MSELKDNLEYIFNEKELKIIPENIKKDVTIFGVTGSLTGGIDTSDADAASSDIVLGKSAYVKEKRIEGELSEVADGQAVEVTEEELNITKSDDGNYEIVYTMPEDKALRSGSTIKFIVSSEKLNSIDSSTEGDV